MGLDLWDGGTLQGWNAPKIGSLEAPSRDKKIGADSGDPNLHSQPRLPGSVVGGWSMRYIHPTDKITGGTVPW